MILFLVEDVTYNIYDQMCYEFEIRRQYPDVFGIRKTLTELAERAEMKEVTKKKKKIKCPWNFFYISRIKLSGWMAKKFLSFTCAVATILTQLRRSGTPGL